MGFRTIYAKVKGDFARSIYRRAEGKRYVCGLVPDWDSINAISLDDRRQVLVWVNPAAIREIHDREAVEVDTTTLAQCIRTGELHIKPKIESFLEL